jgi:hypothetical protein
VIIWIIRNQLARRNLSDAARIQIVSKYKDIISRQAKERQLSGLKQFDNTSTDGTVVANLTQRAEHKKTREVLADMAGVSPRTYTKAEQVYSQAPEPVKDAMRSGIVSIDAAHRATKEAKKDPVVKRKLETTSAERIKDIILIDMKETERRIKRQGKIMDTWVMMATLKYTEDDYEIWLSDMDDGCIGRQLENAENAVKKVSTIQARLVQICKERRRLKLVN